MVRGIRKGLYQFSRTLRKVLIQYMQEREEFIEDPQCNYLIISRRKRQLTYSGINILFRGLKESLKMQGDRVSAHTWRHTFANVFSN
ncbi:tyrosine-type recombinase/integrase [Dendrosporobacter sp. 1207_IL3150]|uniref:tyrosine-type recombinase/integrase n=1 Tax=Dendrosporobacter sp. 1207_IL3150 TaxID=3084054 RepID=UPI003FA5350E